MRQPPSAGAPLSTGRSGRSAATTWKEHAALPYSYDDQKFYVVNLPFAEELANNTPLEDLSTISIYTAKKFQSGGITFSKLTPAEQELFVKSRAKEGNHLVTSEAVRILSLDESRAFEDHFPECVLNSL